MISILIPIFNKDVRKLVAELVSQCKKMNIPFQVLCFDDASKEKYRRINRELESVFGVSYLEFPKNLGRSKMRNKLGFHGMYDRLIFLDCDSKIVTKRFVKKYLDYIDYPGVVYGGTKYQKKKPKSLQKILHWSYGQRRERLSLERRKKSPYVGFRSNNFMISRDLFLLHPFDERIEKYGHEDTLFAQNLKKAKLEIHHIDNAVRHGGLEKTNTFLGKVEESIKNLISLEKRGILIDTSLKRVYLKLQNVGLLRFTLWITEKYKNWMLNNLHGKRPSMYCLDLWKLAKYHKYREDSEIE